MGYKLKELREEARLTQQELADKSGVSRVTIIAIESETKTDVKVGTLKKLARALGIPMEIFFTEIS